MADTPLLSCPFCGQPPEWNMGQHGDGSPWEYLACSHCEAMGPAVGNDDKTEAIVRWNARADDKAKLLDEVERLRAALELETTVVEDVLAYLSPDGYFRAFGKVTTDALRGAARIARTALQPSGSGK